MTAQLYSSDVVSYRDWSLVLKKDPELRMLEDRVLRIFGLQIAELIGHWLTV
jgi:hypothetical protein